MILTDQEKRSSGNDNNQEAEEAKEAHGHTLLLARFPMSHKLDAVG